MIARVSSLLATPWLYLAYQALVGGLRAREQCVKEYIKPTPCMRILDIGCGPGYISQYFRDGSYYGFDIDDRYIEYARRKYGGFGEFYCQPFDAGVLQWLQPVDTVLMMGVLHHLSEDEALALLRLCRLAIKPGGRVITLDGCYQSGESRVSKFFLDHDRGKYIRNEQEYVRLASAVFQKVHDHIRHDLFRIPYTSIVLELIS
jgi:SAM-dependent methyltransferase